MVEDHLLRQMGRGNTQKKASFFLQASLNPNYWLPVTQPSAILRVSVIRKLLLGQTVPLLHTYLMFQILQNFSVTSIHLKWKVVQRASLRWCTKCTKTTLECKGVECLAQGHYEGIEMKMEFPGRFSFNCITLCIQSKADKYVP